MGFEVTYAEGVQQRATGERSTMAETHSLQDLQQPASSNVFVQRDYSSGTICKFQTKFPSELVSRLDKQQFEETIQTLNNLYAEAEKLGGKSYLEGCLACLTAYTIFLCMETHYEKVLKKIARYIKDQNEKTYAPRGLLLTDPIERGLRVVSLTWLMLTICMQLTNTDGHDGYFRTSTFHAPCGSTPKVAKDPYVCPKELPLDSTDFCMYSL
ncbi:golgin subfamily A member 7-like [Diretmus argenteus]